MFIAALFIIAKRWKKPKYPSTDEWVNKYTDTHSQLGVLFSYNKEQNTDICYSVNEPWKHAKWKELDTQGHIIYDSIYMKYPE